MFHEVLACMHCDDHPCYAKCPKQGAAIKLDDAGVVDIVEEACIGCGLCARNCKYTPTRINLVKSADKAKRKAKKCDLCREREEGPACVQWCPVRCIGVNGDPMPELPTPPGPPEAEADDEIAFGEA
jgi:Fe-S-cluster-containing dehydrogenase component